MGGYEKNSDYGTVAGLITSFFFFWGGGGVVALLIATHEPPSRF